MRQKVFNRIWRMHQKSLSVYRDYGDLRVVLFMRGHHRIRQKHFAYMEITFLDMKKTISRYCPFKASHLDGTSTNFDKS
jgi:hypothetical protein